MDLFTQAGVSVNDVVNISPLSDKWANLTNNETVHNLNILLNKVNRERVRKTIYPPRRYVFKAFELNPEDVKVVIIGQDPYHNGNANGRAFACAKNVSPSLNQIGKALNTKFNILNMNLDSWQKQGVLLLNTSLTVEKGIANSHKDLGWRDIIITIIQGLSLYHKNIVYMLWGTSAKSLKSTIVSNNNLILEYSHPASASHNRTTWKCNHFELANNYLKKHNKEPIKWKQ